MNRSQTIGNVKLLDNTRKIERLLHNNDTGKVVFNDICRVMSNVLKSNILVISKKGKVLGYGEYNEIPILSELITDQVGTFIDPALNERFLGVLSTNENVNLGTLGFVREEDCNNVGIIAPIEIAGERLGTVFIYKDGPGFDIDDIILCEYGTTVVGLEMLRAAQDQCREVGDQYTQLYRDARDRAHIRGAERH